jgi:hypothetical protein
MGRTVFCRITSMDNQYRFRVSTNLWAGRLREKLGTYFWLVAFCTTFAFSAASVY